MLMKYSFVLVLSAISFVASAKPAPWYWWASQLNDGRICLQTSPGDGWYRDGGPYKDSRCRNDQLR